MANNVLGFIGIENFEIILYLSRILEKLERRVLLIDYSETSDLTSCILVPEFMDPEVDIITYGGIDFTSKQLNQDLLDEYTDVLINFGFSQSHMNETNYCTSIIFCVNQLMHNIKRLTPFISVGIKAADKSLLIKDVVRSKINPEYIMDQLKFKDNVFVLYLDEVDKRYSILAQYDPYLPYFQFRRISRQAREYLFNMVMKISPGIPEKVLNEAYKAAERGR